MAKAARKANEDQRETSVDRSIDDDLGGGVSYYGGMMPKPAKNKPLSEEQKAIRRKRLWIMVVRKEIPRVRLLENI